MKSIDAVAEFLGLKPEKLIKTLAYEVDDDLVLVLLRGDNVLSEDKLKTALNAKAMKMADDAMVAKRIGAPGFIGPHTERQALKVVADFGLKSCSGMVMGSNRKDYHLKGVNVSRDINAEYFDIREAQNNDPCGQCGSPYTILRGIEVGHIFYLGKKYSKALKAVFQDQNGESLDMEMGCYGIGVSRTAAAAIEQNHDERGIMWPAALAPYQIHIVQLGVEEELRLFSREVYDKLCQANFEVLLDDRDERAGVKLNDADLLGLPLRISIGKRGLKNGEIEVLPRRRQEEGPIFLPRDNYLEPIKELLASL